MIGSSTQQNASSGTAGNISPNLLKKANSVPVVEAGTTIAFASAFADTNYTIDLRCYLASGDNNDFKITNKTVNGFKVTPSADGFVDYLCFKS